MKPLPNIPGRPRRMNNSGFTVMEMMISSWVYLIIMLGVVLAIQVFALRIYTLAATKTAATTGSLKTLNAVRQQIRSANTVDVGNCNSTPNSFNSLATNSWQIGNALRIYLYSGDTNNYTVFYMDNATSTNYLRQFSVITNGPNFVTNTAVLASFFTNQDLFTAEDYQGNTITNDQSLDNRLVIHMKLQFYMWEYPIAYVGTAGLNAYDYYQLETRVTRRANY